VRTRRQLRAPGSVRPSRCAQSIARCARPAAALPRDVVRVREGGLVVHHGAHAHALVDAEGAGLHDSLFEEYDSLRVYWKYRSRSRCGARTPMPGRAAGSPPPAQRLKQQSARGREPFERGVSRFHDAFFQKTGYLGRGSLRTFQVDCPAASGLLQIRRPASYPAPGALGRQ